MRDLNDVLADVYNLEQEGKHREAGRTIMRFMFECMANDISTFDSFMQSVDFTKLNVPSVLGLMRPTCSIKAQLPSWDAAYEKSVVRLRELEKNPEDLLIGLS